MDLFLCLQSVLAIWCYCRQTNGNSEDDDNIMFASVLAIWCCCRQTHGISVDDDDDDDIISAAFTSLDIYDHPL